MSRFEILFVCHANLCRSPLAERLARRAFDDVFGLAGSGVVISSAGTHAYGGTPMHRSSAAVLAECGVDAGGFSTRTLNASILGAADLVLTAAREQRAACVTLAPATVRRTFTIRQFTRLAVATCGPGGSRVTVPGQLCELVGEVGASRHLVPAVAAELDDLSDPVGRPIRDFRECAQEIWRAVSSVVNVMADRSPRPPRRLSTGTYATPGAAASRSPVGPA